jgi:hypothetical protein
MHLDSPVFYPEADSAEFVMYPDPTLDFTVGEDSPNFIMYAGAGKDSKV